MLKNLLLLGCLFYLATAQGLFRICSDSKYRQGLMEGGCVRYVRGWDITGVTTTVHLTHQNGINNACDCMLACKNRDDTCASWVWKFTDSTEYRTCTLYSDFNLPPSVTIFAETNSSVNLGEFDNPHVGGKVPRCLTSVGNYDSDCYSGALWYLDNGQYLC